MADMTGATSLMNAALLGALITCLRDRGILSKEDVIGLSDLALLYLETQQKDVVSPNLTEAFDVARKMLEIHLKPERKAP